jgi:hypothetical protein
VITKEFSRFEIQCLVSQMLAGVRITRFRISVKSSVAKRKPVATRPRHTEPRSVRPSPVIYRFSILDYRCDTAGEFISAVYRLDALLCSDSNGLQWRFLVIRCRNAPGIFGYFGFPLRRAY